MTFRSKFRFVFCWYDLWIGLYYDRKARVLYVFPVPMCGLEIHI